MVRIGTGSRSAQQADQSIDRSTDRTNRAAQPLTGSGTGREGTAMKRCNLAFRDQVEQNAARRRGEGVKMTPDTYQAIVEHFTKRLRSAHCVTSEAAAVESQCIEVHFDVRRAPVTVRVVPLGWYFQVVRFQGSRRESFYLQ